MTYTAEILARAAASLPADKRQLVELIIESASEIADRKRVVDHAGRREAERYLQEALWSILADHEMVAMPATAWFGVILPFVQSIVTADDGAGAALVEGSRFKASLDFVDVGRR